MHLPQDPWARGNGVRAEGVGLELHTWWEGLGIPEGGGPSALSRWLAVTVGVTGKTGQTPAVATSEMAFGESSLPEGEEGGGPMAYPRTGPAILATQSGHRAIS